MKLSKAIEVQMQNVIANSKQGRSPKIFCDFIVDYLERHFPEADVSISEMNSELEDYIKRCLKGRN